MGVFRLRDRSRALSAGLVQVQVALGSARAHHQPSTPLVSVVSRALVAGRRCCCWSLLLLLLLTRRCRVGRSCQSLARHPPSSASHTSRSLAACLSHRHTKSPPPPSSTLASMSSVRDLLPDRTPLDPQELLDSRRSWFKSVLHAALFDDRVSSDEQTVWDSNFQPRAAMGETESGKLAHRQRLWKARGPFEQAKRDFADEWSAHLVTKAAKAAASKAAAKAYRDAHPYVYVAPAVLPSPTHGQDRLSSAQQIVFGQYLERADASGEKYWTSRWALEWHMVGDPYVYERINDALTDDMLDATTIAERTAEWQTAVKAITQDSDWMKRMFQKAVA